MSSTFSSHERQICNAGFIVPPAQRGKKIGGALAKSFLEYAPRLGYRASVFNLVYKSESRISCAVPISPFFVRGTLEAEGRGDRRGGGGES
jgi:GNAT superfamily N-acetyltransferase